MKMGFVVECGSSGATAPVYPESDVGSMGGPSQRKECPIMTNGFFDLDLFVATVLRLDLEL